ncbi:MAG: putative porin [Candidatus Omnitrophica bacterium]|nr:putative porin [Candidatus Omnitrophota bacterium]
MNIVKKICLPLVSIMAVFFIAQPLYAGEIDILVNKLVEKGVLTYGEAQQIVTETKEQVRAELIAGKSTSVPQWVQNLKLKGDLRLRHQYDDKEKDSVSGRHRGRIRFRLGMETKLSEQFNFAAGLATGSEDPRSTNQTFQDSFATKGIQLDYAYMQYNPISELTLYGGKMARSKILWEPTDLLWDGDITPEGVAAVWSKKIDSSSLFFNSGFFVLDESSSKSNEPYMVYFQPGFSWKLDDNLSLKGALSYYIIHSKDYDMDNSADTNTKTGSSHKYDYDSISPALELTWKDPFSGLVPEAKMFGEYVKASDPSSDDSGWAVGLAFGDSSVNDKGKWQIRYVYRLLERMLF